MTESGSDPVQRVLDALTEAPPHRRLRVALSGGLDSTVLVHALAASGSRPEVVHVHHGLQPAANDFAEAARAHCRSLDLSFELRHVDAAPADGESPEAAAREARYRVLLQDLTEDDVLALAHHAGDRVETVLLQLLRGAGPAGLAGMPLLSDGPGPRLWRPLLGVARSCLEGYARAQGLDWVEDPTNSDLEVPRNHLRHVVLPTLSDRWPGLERTLGRSASHLADVDRLARSIARDDLSRTLRDGGLDTAALSALEPVRRVNLLRWWLRDVGLPVPDSRAMASLITQLDTPGDAEPRIAWPGCEVRRSGGVLYAGPPLPDPPGGSRRWDGRGQAVWPGLGRLSLEEAVGDGLAADRLVDRELELRFREGGERIRPPGRPTRRLKALFQEAGVPPWRRERTPLLFVDGELVAVPGIAVAEAWSAAPERPGRIPRWVPEHGL